MQEIIWEESPSQFWLLEYKTEGNKPLTPGHVYVLGSNTDPFIKIGRAGQGGVAARLEAAQTYNPHRLTVLHTIDTPYTEALEQTLHRWFSPSRAHPRSEWFHLDGEVKAWLSEGDSSLPIVHTEEAWSEWFDTDRYSPWNKWIEWSCSCKEICSRGEMARYEAWQNDALHTFYPKGTCGGVARTSYKYSDPERIIHSIYYGDGVIYGNNCCNE